MKIEDWFVDKDYGIGLAILGETCKNRILLQNLSRKHNPAKLEYELTKIAKEQGFVIGHVKETLVDVPDTALPLADETGEKEEKWVNPHELPEHLKAKWHENQDAYKEIRSLHEKLKLMENATPEYRQPLTERIAVLDEKIRLNWEEIDAWTPGQETKKADTNVDFNRINANRKFISTNLKKIIEEKIQPSKLDEVKKEMIIRILELKASGQEFTSDTLDELKKAGIEC